MDWDKIRDDAGKLISSQTGLTEVIVWNGLELSGVRSQLKRSDVHADAGLASNYDFSVLVPTSLFGGIYPDPRRDKVLISGKQYRVLSLEHDGAGALVRLNLGALYQ